MTDTRENATARVDVEFHRFDPVVEEAYLEDGTRITAAVLDELEVRAARTSPFRNLVPGGKSLSGGSTHSPRLQVALGEPVAARVRDRAAAENMSVSRWLRRLIEREVA